MIFYYLEYRVIISFFLDSLEGFVVCCMGFRGNTQGDDCIRKNFKNKIRDLDIVILSIKNIKICIKMTMNGLDSKQYKYIVSSSKQLYHEKWVSKHKYHWLDSFISTHNIPNLFLNAWNCKLKFITPEISSKKNCNPQQNKTMVFCMHSLEIDYRRLRGTQWWRQKLT